MQAPPFSLPGEHFAAALIFLGAGGGLLAWRSSALASGSFLDPGVQAGTHLFTLGWISTSIMGALYQFLPVALGAGVRRERMADLTFVGWILGVVSFVVGLAGGWRPLYLAGAALLGLAVLLFVAIVGDALRRARVRGLTWWCVSGALTALLGVWTLGGLLALNLETGMLGAGRLTVLAIHLHVAAGGWVLLTIIGVADHLLPMFLLSHGATRIPGRIAAALMGLGGAGLLLTGHLLPESALRPALGTMAAAVLAFLLQAALFFRHRMRRDLDPGMLLVAGALVLLGGTVAVGTTILLSPRPGGRLLTAYGILLVPGGLSLFIAGHYYRILPFLTWFHRFGPVAAEQEVPRVRELFDHRVARATGALLFAGVGITAAGVLVGQPIAVFTGSVAFCLGAASVAGQMLHLSRKRPA